MKIFAVQLALLAFSMLPVHASDDSAREELTRANISKDSAAKKQTFAENRLIVGFSESIIPAEVNISEPPFQAGAPLKRLRKLRGFASAAPEYAVAPPVTAPPGELLLLPWKSRSES